MEKEFTVESFGIQAMNYRPVIDFGSRNCICAPAVMDTYRFLNPTLNNLNLAAWKIPNDSNIVFFF